MCHEHILIDGRGIFIEPTCASDKVKAYLPIEKEMSLENLGWINYNWLSNIDNLLLGDEEVAAKEMELYRRSGGNSIVEVTPIGVGRDPNGLARVSRSSGIHIIMGTSYYVNALQPPEVESMSEDEICDKFVQEITIGIVDVMKGGGVSRVGQIPVKAGLIGEIGCTWPWQKNEKKVMRAAARAQHFTGAPLSIHPGRSEQAILEAIELLDKAGANLKRTIIGHIERTIVNFDVRKKVAEAGCYLEYDEFMMESNYPLSDVDFPNDYERINQIVELINHGYGEQILVSHDMCIKTRLVTYGGLGYGHILNNIVPKMRRKKISDTDIENILINNPKKVLTFSEPQN
jgi:phosphotriesterase-related protein